MLLRPWRIREALWISSGALLLIVSGLVPLRLATRAVGKGVDVYFFLTGMMLLAELARHEGVFDWIADVAVRHAGNSAARLFLLIYFTGVVVTALLSNDATAVVLTPAVLAAVRRARVDPKPYFWHARSWPTPQASCCRFPTLQISSCTVNTFRRWVRGSEFSRCHPPLRCDYLFLPSIFVAQSACARSPLSERTGFSQRSRASRARRTRLRIGRTARRLRTRSKAGRPYLRRRSSLAHLVSIKDRGIFKRAAIEITWSILPLVAGLFILVEALQRRGHVAAD